MKIQKVKERFNKKKNMLHAKKESFLILEDRKSSLFRGGGDFPNFMVAVGGSWVFYTRKGTKAVLIDVPSSQTKGSVLY